MDTYPDNTKDCKDRYKICELLDYTYPAHSPERLHVLKMVDTFRKSQRRSLCLSSRSGTDDELFFLKAAVDIIIQSVQFDVYKKYAMIEEEGDVNSSYKKAVLVTSSYRAAVTAWLMYL